MTKIGLALGSGGARGIAHINFIKAFEELNIKPSIIAGTSIGALIGAMYASGNTTYDFIKILKDRKYSLFLKIMDLNILNTSSIFEGKAVYNFIKELVPYSSFKELNIPLKIIATDFWSRKQELIEEGDLIKAIRASISIPSIFKPVNFNNKILVDGGIVNPVPYDVIKNHCDICIAIDVSGQKEISNKIPNLIESIINTFEILQDAVLDSKLKLSKPDIYIKVSLKNIGVFDFHKHKKILDLSNLDINLFKNNLIKVLKTKKYSIKNIFKK